MDDPKQPAIALNRDSFGDPANNGVRDATVLADTLYFGSSTFSNLPPPQRQGQAGGELFTLRRNTNASAAIEP